MVAEAAATRSAPRSMRRRGAARLGRRRRPGSARTPTPRRTWRSAATATGSWSSWPRTPPTPRPAAGVPGRLLLHAVRRRAHRVQHRRAARRRPGWRRSRRCAPRPSAGQHQRRPVRRRLRRRPGAHRRAAVCLDHRVGALGRRPGHAGRVRRPSPWLADEADRRDGQRAGAAAAVAADRGARPSRAGPPRCGCRCATPLAEATGATGCSPRSTTRCCWRCPR